MLSLSVKSPTAKPCAKNGTWLAGRGTNLKKKEKKGEEKEEKKGKKEKEGKKKRGIQLLLLAKLAFDPE